MPRYYFTYGMSKTMPFQNGWTVIEANDRVDACTIFRTIHTNPINDRLLNCATSYSEEEFNATTMSKNGNLGAFEHEYVRKTDDGLVWLKGKTAIPVFNPLDSIALSIIINNFTILTKYDKICALKPDSKDMRVDYLYYDENKPIYTDETFKNYTPVALPKSEDMKILLENTKKFSDYLFIYIRKFNNYSPQIVIESKCNGLLPENKIIVISQGKQYIKNKEPDYYEL